MICKEFQSMKLFWNCEEKINVKDLEKKASLIPGFGCRHKLCWCLWLLCGSCRSAQNTRFSWELRDPPAEAITRRQRRDYAAPLWHWLSAFDFPRCAGSFPASFVSSRPWFWPTLQQLEVWSQQDSPSKVIDKRGKGRFPLFGFCSSRIDRSENHLHLFWYFGKNLRLVF